MPSVTPDTSDALVIGGGPAGLAAALSLCRQNHNVTVFDSGDYRNKYASEMHMVSTWDHHKPGDYLSASREELTLRYPDQCRIVQGEVTNIERVSGTARGLSVFEVHDEAGNTWRGRKVILATGVRDLLPFIDGFEDCWGTGVVHCLLCHGHEQRGAASVGILALDSFAEASTVLRVARSCKQFASNIRIYTNGNKRVATQLRAVAAQVPGCAVEPAVIERLEMVKLPGGGDEDGLHVLLEGAGEGITPEHVHSFAMYHAGTEQASPLVEALGVELDEDGEIKLGAFQETSRPGVFAAGDCASLHKYVSIASATGFMAGAGAAQQLQAEGM
ncbi:putative thioredoxin reductase [Diaporthe ampelina]|uniref:Putative thioredoxin reductase n=1 Tax=Diaporthe ampelina TaxID=1214573 RepID=A0A0G2FFE0_9PEZI|nr:putative thioredoxin reductase [Diaporthe ampelina]